MQCEMYAGDVPALITWLTRSDIIGRYLDESGSEIGSMAEARLVDHLRRLQTIARHVQLQGLESAAERDRGATDALLTDVFAWGTFCSWDDMPVSKGLDEELPLEVVQRGLLGADESTEGALLFVPEEGVIALARNREPSPEALAERDRSDV